VSPNRSKDFRLCAADAQPPLQTHTPQQWQEGHKLVITMADGFLPLERINAAGLSGYILPRLIEGHQYHKSVFAQLANARVAGLTQTQIKQQMKRDGFIK